MNSKLSLDSSIYVQYESCRAEFLQLSGERQKRTEQGWRCEVLGARSEVEAPKRPTRSEKTRSNARNQLDECYNDRERHASTE